MDFPLSPMQFWICLGPIYGKPGPTVCAVDPRALSVPLSGPDPVPRALGDSCGKLWPVGGGTKTSGRQKASGCQTDELGKEPWIDWGWGLPHRW